MRWTPADLPDLTGRTAVVTGANSGIGVHTARELAAHGASVVLACRNVAAGEQVAASIPGSTRVVELDLASQKSVRVFAESWAGPLDLLVNNAGVMTPPQYRETEDGFELQYGTNHLGHFALTGLLMPALAQGSSPRVVTVASIAHHNGDERVLAGNPAGVVQAVSRPTATPSSPTCSSHASCSAVPGLPAHRWSRPPPTPASPRPTSSRAPTAWAPTRSSAPWRRSSCR